MINILHRNKIPLLLIVPLISFIGSLYQSVYAYDGFHWGLILFSAESLNLGLKPYKEIFIHYGFLTTFLNSIFLKLFNNNFTGLFFISSLAYACSIALLSILIFQKTNLIYGFIGGLIIFFLHPFAVDPWHNYVIFFVFNIYLLLFLNKNYYLKLLSPFFLSLCILFSESFVYPAICLFLFHIIYIILFSKILSYEKIIVKTVFLKIIIFIIPILFFLLFVQINNIYEFWLLNQELPTIFLKEIHKTNFQSLILNLFKNFINYAVYRFFSEPYWTFYFLIIIFNIFFLIKKMTDLFKKKKQDKLSIDLIFISFSSLIFLYNTVHNFSVFKLATGSVLGIVIIFHLINKLKEKNSRIIILAFLILFSLYGFEFIQSSNNKLFVEKYKKNEFINSKYFNYFSLQRWNEETWYNLIFLDKKLKLIRKTCNIKYLSNLTNDAFYSIIARKYFLLYQLLPWYENKDKSYMNSYYKALFNHFDNDFFNLTKKKIYKNILIIITNKENFPNLRLNGELINISEKMYFIDIPYSYQHKKKIILLPKNCNYKLNK